MWKVTGERIYPKGDNPLDNRFYGYRETTLLLPDGRSAIYHGLVVPDCVHVVAIEDDETTYLVRQSRPNVRAIGQRAVPETLELPGGFSEPDLGLIGSAQRELQDEINRRAGHIVQIGVLYPSVGVSNEQDHIFFATGLEPSTGDMEREATEQDMQIVAGKFGELYRQMLRSRLPVSAQTVAAFALAASHL